MIKQVLRTTALAAAGLMLTLPAKAGMVDDAISAFAELDGYVQKSNDQIEDYEMDAAKTSLDEAQDGIAEYGELLNGINDASDNLAGLLGDAWEPAVSASANLSARITDTLGRVDSGTADFDGLISAADNAESAFNTARAFTQQFRGKLFAFREVTLADMRKLFDSDVGPNLEAARAALTARNGNEAQAKLALVVKALETLMSQANAAASMTVTLGDSVTKATESVWPSFAVLQKDVQSLQAVAGKSNPASALATITASEDTADKALNEAVNRMTDIEGRFVLICDSACR